MLFFWKEASYDMNIIMTLAPSSNNDSRCSEGICAFNSTSHDLVTVKLISVVLHGWMRIPVIKLAFVLKYFYPLRVR